MRDLKTHTILIVDDDEDLRETIIFDFEQTGFRVLSASNGIDAYNLVLNNKISLVISDIRMPGGDGIALLEKIRKYDPKIPTVILITGYASLSEKQCQEKGAAKVFNKPFETDELMNYVFKILEIAPE